MFGQSITKVLVFGWFCHNNAGDDWFKEAFQHLFPNFNFIFTDCINLNHLRDIDVVFIGGGSFLEGVPDISNEALIALKNKKIFYIGVGTETNIHPIHQELIKQSLLIATRSNQKLSELQKLNSNILVIPDLIYSLQHLIPSAATQAKSILVLPNIYVVPKWNEPNWKHTSWNYFKSEFAQFLDYLLDEKYLIDFFPMASEDLRMASEIVNHMVHPLAENLTILNNYCQTFNEYADLFSIYSTVITQRYHGMILSEMSTIPYLTIHHHDKLRSSYDNLGEFIPYYELSKNKLIEQFHKTETKTYPILSIKQDIFEELRQTIIKTLDQNAPLPRN